MRYMVARNQIVGSTRVEILITIENNTPGIFSSRYLIILTIAMDPFCSNSNKIPEKTHYNTCTASQILELKLAEICLSLSLRILLELKLAEICHFHYGFCSSI